MGYYCRAYHSLRPLVMYQRVIGQRRACGNHRVPEQAVNFACGGPGLRTLLCRAHTSVYTLRVKVPAIRIPGTNCTANERGYGYSYWSCAFMTPRRYGPLPYVPITRRPKLTWPDGARV